MTAWKIRGLVRRPWLLVLVGIAATGAVVLFTKWKSASDHGGQRPAQPFRIAGNLYYVGASDVTSFLLTGPEGHVLIDGGYPGTAPMIMASIAKLGFDIRDVKVLLNSEPHFDHAGGLAELQKASGAQLWASEASADALEAGGDEGANSSFLPYRILVWVGILRYSRPHVDHRFSDGATVSVGSIKLTAHITGGHTHGCTTWTLPVRDGVRDLNVVSACSLTILPGMRLADPQRYPGIRADFEHSFAVLRSLPEDIWVTSHARVFGRYRKFLERGNVKDSADAFIDRDGYRGYIDSAETRFRAELAEEQARHAR